MSHYRKQTHFKPRLTPEIFFNAWSWFSVSSSGDVYDGDWVKDKRQGHGELRTVAGTIYTVSEHC